MPQIRQQSTHFLAEREENRLKTQHYNWTPEISPLDKWQHDWIAGGVFEEGANSSRHALRCLIPTNTPTTLTLRSIQLTQTNQRQFYSWQPRHRYRHRPLLPPAPPPQPSNPQHHMSSCTNAGTTHQPHFTLPLPCSPAHPTEASRATPVPYILISPSFLACSEYLPSDPATPMPLGSTNHIATTTGPRPTHAHGGYPLSCLTPQPANHPQTNNSAYPRALKRRGRRRRTPPTTTITGNTSTSTRTQTIKSGQLTALLNLSPRHQNYTTPPHHRGLPPGAATPPIPPHPWFPQQRWSRLEWARGIGSATPRPPLRRDAVGLRRAATPYLDLAR